MYAAAINTKFLGPTDSRGARVKATSQAGSLTLAWDHALGASDNHAAAASALASKLRWAGQWIAGGMPDGCGNVFVCLRRSVDGGSATGEGFDVDDAGYVVAKTY